MSPEARRPSESKCLGALQNDTSRATRRSARLGLMRFGLASQPAARAAVFCLALFFIAARAGAKKRVSIHSVSGAAM